MKINIEFDLNNENDRKTYEHYLNIKTLKEDYSKDISELINDMKNKLENNKKEIFIRVEEYRNDLSTLINHLEYLKNKP
jgi:uncharacterized protein YajQ (UPF0234 family)